MKNFKNLNSPFSNLIYRKLFIAQATSLFGTGITTIALALLAWQIAGNQAGQVLGTALAIKMIAYVLLSPFVGSFAHKIPKRLWFITLDILRVLFVLCLPFINQVWQIYVLILLINACSALFTPVFQSTIADIIKDEEQYRKALTFSRIAYNLEQLLSPSIAALLLLVVSFNVLFTLDAITFLISAGLILNCKFPLTTKPDRPERFLNNLRFGINSYIKTPRLKALIALYVIVATASAMIIINTVVILNGSESATAIAMAVSGAGSMLAAILLPKLLNKFEIRKVLLSSASILVMTLYFASSISGLVSLLFAWFLIGMGLSLVQTPVGSLIRNSCSESDSPAFFAANFSISHFCWLFAYLLAGYLGPLIGLETTFLFMGTISMAALIIAWKIYPNPDYLVLEHTHQELNHEHYHVHDEHHNHTHQESIESIHIHTHGHKPIRHEHKFVIDFHHQEWPCLNKL